MSDWFVRPLAFHEEKSVVAWGKPENDNFVFARPPWPNLQIWTEYLLPDGFPDGLPTHVLERRRNVIRYFGCNRLVEHNGRGFLAAGAVRFDESKPEAQELVGDFE